jgi:Transposase
MLRIAAHAALVTGGVDTHADVHVAAVADRVGRVLGTRAFPATAAGYRAAVAWTSAHGELARVGVEGTGSYGAGLARYLASCGIEVAGVIRPDRQARRQRGKSDAADAVAAALAALSGEASGMPKSRDGAAEAGPGAESGPGGRDQGPHPGRQPAARLDRHRTRAATPAAGRAALRAAGGDSGPVPARRTRHARPGAPRRRWPAWPAATSS